LQGVVGVELIASTGHIFNGGQILATSEARAAVDVSQGTAGFTLRNSGEISGPVKAILGSAFADVITNKGTVEGTIDLGAGADKFYGRMGLLDSRISGGADNDLIQSGRGDDVLDGGSGIDTLAGNLGDDSLTGGSSADIFVFQRRGGDDVVTDFTHGSDKLDLRAFHLVNFAAVSSVMHAHVGGVEIDLSPYAGGTVELVGLTLAQVTVGDFLI
jgi:Ca2+-binding RTX toxin-like protein